MKNHESQGSYLALVCAGGIAWLGRPIPESRQMASLLEQQMAARSEASRQLP